ncbi:hypothetical protein PWT90_08044 [Aphanocladium album]|nr:hypothetical protein PWT90_08044 [Aphanocladium album]
MPEFRPHPILEQKSSSFCQNHYISTTTLSRATAYRGHKVWLHGVAKDQGFSISDVELDFDQVITGTGPSASTKAVLNEKNKAQRDWRSEITWDTSHNLDEAAGRVLMLSVEAFCTAKTIPTRATMALVSL